MSEKSFVTSSRAIELRRMRSAGRKFEREWEGCNKAAARLSGEVWQHSESKVSRPAPLISAQSYHVALDIKARTKFRKESNFMSEKDAPTRNSDDFIKRWWAKRFPNANPPTWKSAITCADAADLLDKFRAALATKRRT